MIRITLDVLGCLVYILVGLIIAGFAGLLFYGVLYILVLLGY